MVEYKDKGEKMKSLQLVVKKYKEHPSIKTILTVLASIVVCVFIPHLAGSLISKFYQFSLPVWPVGLICIILIGVVALIFLTMITTVPDRLKRNVKIKEKK